MYIAGIGQILLASDPLNSEQVHNQIIRRLEREIAQFEIDNKAVSLPEQYAITLNGDRFLTIPLVLNNNAGECIGFTILYGPHAGARKPDINFIKLLANAIETEANLNEELNEMAEELTIRYDELNLVYSTNERVDQKINDEQLLSYITTNVCNYLDAQITLIYIPEKNLWVCHTVNLEESDKLEKSFRAAMPTAIDMLRENDESFVVNDTKDLAGYNLTELASFRSLVVPIRDQSNSIVGGIAMFKTLDKNRITNSDKNLVVAMASKVSQIVQYSYDPVTGLPHQEKFDRQLRQMQSLLEARQTHIYLHVSVPEMSFIIDHYGVKVANQIYDRVAHALLQTGRESDLCGRLDSGDLAMLLLNCSLEVAEKKALVMAKSQTRNSMLFGTRQVSYSVAVGLSQVHSGGSFNSEEVVYQGALANKIAEQKSEKPVQVFSADDHQIQEHKSWGKTLEQVNLALSNDNFLLYAQSIAPLANHDTSPHFEVLIRLQDHEHGLVPPDVFIPVAEKYNLMPQIDLWVISNTLEQLSTSGLTDIQPGTVCSINISGQSFSSKSFLEDVLRLVKNSQIAPYNICFEVTETAAINDLGIAQSFIKNLRRLGCKFALDDFGTGVSSFTYLRELPLDYVKIDGSFVKDMLTDRVAASMVKSIHDIGQAMGLQTVAEYVENSQISDTLKSYGLDFGQGYGIDKPIPLDEYLIKQLELQLVELARLQKNQATFLDDARADKVDQTGASWTPALSISESDRTAKPPLSAAETDTSIKHPVRNN